MKELLIVYR